MTLERLQWEGYFSLMQYPAPTSCPRFHVTDCSINRPWMSNCSVSHSAKALLLTVLRRRMHQSRIQESVQQLTRLVNDGDDLLKKNYLERINRRPWAKASLAAQPARPA